MAFVIWISITSKRLKHTYAPWRRGVPANPPPLVYLALDFLKTSKVGGISFSKGVCIDASLELSCSPHCFYHHLIDLARLQHYVSACRPDTSCRRHTCGAIGATLVHAIAYHGESVLGGILSALVLCPRIPKEIFVQCTASPNIEASIYNNKYIYIYLFMACRD